MDEVIAEDSGLRTRLTPADWAAYDRWSAVADSPPREMLPGFLLARQIAWVIATLYGAGLVFSLALGLTDGLNAEWVAAVSAVIFGGAWLVPEWVRHREESAVRAGAEMRRDEVASAAEAAGPSEQEQREEHLRRVLPRLAADPGEHDRGRGRFFMTGDYDPGLYMARGGRQEQDRLMSLGYSSYDEYEANHPD
ncbi:hypothetical protein [Microbacterium sp. 77mftsu3.1]|uniref:hypothetical protein n=1 Tax=Microbacterium sp. 77mftsu3.1 TaxID=1761802 RepID=UPI0003797607|nr:hypothetical protein [Microbacterium sp. 77mftsu3.1]SDH34998.1 hypothetical protein SAMN04488590_3100 [Microbacterium sp. 77mftsu3.1]